MKESITSIISSLQTATNELELLKEQVDEPEVEEGEWLTNPSNPFIARVNKVKGSWADITGITANGEWIENGDAYIGSDTDLIKATDDEVEQSLIKEARCRFEGKKVGSMDGGISSKWGMGTATWDYKPDKDELWLSKCIKLYDKGSWAEIIEDEWEVREVTPSPGEYYLIKGGERTIDGNISKQEAEAIADALNNLD